MEGVQHILVFIALGGALAFLILKFFYPKVLKSKRKSTKGNCGTDCAC